MKKKKDAKNQDLVAEVLTTLHYMLLLGHGVTLFPNQVQYSHTSLVGTTKDLSSYD